MSTCAADRYVITRLALERARALRPDLARASDDVARATLAAEVAAGRAEQSRDFRDGSEQQLVALGADVPWGFAVLKTLVALGADVPWGFAVLKTGVVVTIVDEPGARYLRARAAQPVASRTCPKCGYVEASC